MMFFGGWMWLLWIVVIGVVVWAVVAGGRHNTSGHDSPSKTPLEIAKERYARGEITREEYEQLRRDLS